MDKLRIAAVQFDIIWRDSKANLEKLNDILSNVKKDSVDLIVLPEMFNSGFTNSVMGVSEEMQGSTVSWMKSTSEKLGSAILGSIIIEDEGKFYNRALFVKGDSIEYYDKRHLFSYSGEDKEFESGDQRVVFEYMGWKIFPQICYDLRFPVWSRNDIDYDLIVYVANWPKSRISFWKKLLQARAIENLSYVIAVNRVGIDGENIAYSGNSMVLNPFGKKIAKTKKNKEELLILDIDKKELNQIRSKYKFLDDKDVFEIK